MDSYGGIVNVINKWVPTKLSLRAKRGNLMGLLRPPHQVRGPRNDNLSMAFAVINLLLLATLLS